MTDMWYVAMNGQQLGPLPTQQVFQLIQAGRIDGSAYVYGPGMADWAPIMAVRVLAAALQPPFTPPPPSPPPTAPAPSVDVIDYEILGDRSQFVEITLDPGEACVADAATLVYMEAGIEVVTVTADGEVTGEHTQFMRALLARGSAFLLGGRFALTVFGNAGRERRRVAFAAPGIGSVVALDLRERGGNLLVQKDAFLCAAKGISVEVVVQKPHGGGYGPDGFVLQLLEGAGLAFLHAGGAVVPRDLQPGETLRVEASCLVALEPRVTWDVQAVEGVRSPSLGAEGLLLASVTGPGRVWLQSLPAARIAGRTLSPAGAG